MNSSEWNLRISQRRYNNSDLAFLETLYGSTREYELSKAVFTPSEKTAFISQQFSAQTLHYTQNYCTNDFNIVEVDGVPAGRLFIDYWDREIRIVDIALLPQFQQSGLGSYLIKEVFKTAYQSNKPVTIHVEFQNPARILYERLGFQYKQKTNDVYLLMQWTP